MGNNMDGMNEGFEWLSVGEVAKNEKVTPQTIYKRIKEGLYETMEFNRGSMRGILIKYKKRLNTWKEM